VGGDVVAKVFNLGARKGLVDALDLLQAQGVGALLPEVIEQVRQPLADGIDVPGGDDQGRGSAGERPRAFGERGADPLPNAYC